MHICIYSKSICHTNIWYTVCFSEGRERKERGYTIPVRSYNGVQ